MTEENHNSSEVPGEIKYCSDYIIRNGNTPLSTTNARKK
jgi:hypothetical protein